MKSASPSRSTARYFVSWPVSLVIFLALGCGVYTFSGGGGLPGHIDTIAIIPLDNETTQFTLTQELTQALLDEVPGRLGLDLADESSADAILRGRIVRYDERASNLGAQEGGPTVFQRRVDIGISVEIYDAIEDRVIWSGSPSAFGQYEPDRETEQAARLIAIEELVRLIIDGAQSQW